MAHQQPGEKMIAEVCSRLHHAPGIARGADAKAFAGIGHGHLRIKRFLGTSENAVKTQIWCAVSTCVLIAIVKKELHLDASLYTLLQILSVLAFENTQISCALQPDTAIPDVPNSSNKSNLFTF